MLFEEDTAALTVKEASVVASKVTQTRITTENIHYLIRYGVLKQIRETSGGYVLNQDEVITYFEERLQRLKEGFKNSFSCDLNWRLSFAEYRESETTKHVHRIHPYKGKFIPQLVEYFVDSHTDEFKTESYFRQGDVILDPFCGSGTTLVQCNELGIHALGVDISEFNALISNCKLADIDHSQLHAEALKINTLLESDETSIKARILESELKTLLSEFNKKHFPSPHFRRAVSEGDIEEDSVGHEHALEFCTCFYELCDEYSIDFTVNEDSKRFLDRWFVATIRHELALLRQQIFQIASLPIRNLLSLVLTRTARSVRATKHYDLATLIQPIQRPYYCSKHYKICTPKITLHGWWKRYLEDTARRLVEFKSLRTDTFQECVVGDSKNLDFLNKLRTSQLTHKISEQKFQGIFTSPPYVGLIDYHDQHAYAYEILELPRRDEFEIGSLSNGQRKEAREQYVDEIAAVFNNVKPYLAEDFNVFIVANDRFGLYPKIAEKAGYSLVNEFKRPVLNRAEGIKGKYLESIFHLRGSTCASGS
ncbi:MAG: site-specific DNA-methyltransferase [Gammaproteobacteria bacterium]|nr:site-specific DNA-methyltransferase [Gammaproteobacteria bacterium]